MNRPAHLARLNALPEPNRLANLFAITHPRRKLNSGTTQVSDVRKWQPLFLAR
jgi:hypothetical protein